MSRFLAPLCFALAAVVALPAAAADPMRPEGWQTGVMRKPDGEFVYCVTESKFPHGLWLVLALNPTGDVNLGVGQQGANLPVGEQKPARVVIDNQPALEMTAKAIKPELMVINAGQSESFLNALAKGNTLQVGSMVFALDGSGQAIATLRECVQASVSTAGVAPQSAPVDQTAAAPAAEPAPPTPQIVWNQPPVAPPGQRDANTLPPSLQQAQAPQIQAVQPAVVPAPATEPAVVMAPELTPPAPDAHIQPIVPQQQAQAAPAATLPASKPVATPVTKPLPAQLERLLLAAKVRDLEAAPVTESDVAFAWKSRDMLGNVREIAVPAGSNVVQLAGQHFSALKDRCDAEFVANLGQPESVGALDVLTGSTVCRGNGKSVYTTLVFALSRQGVLSIVAHQIDQGRRAAPDRAQVGVVAALKDTQG